ncbi:hypothetical protein BCR44DRAFT_354989 [Catenaria anguillulae PL171]|uniref:Uncharacterized protein n=1 Tax=Catenaria anguillulae PL171 TaxID=765915 RepID=A0A1Y2HDU9_9FUNG|nr:hypothetical protein BCR44DRAFT_354989 [Catenaria anguillulae PL171]
MYPPRLTAHRHTLCRLPHGLTAFRGDDNIQIHSLCKLTQPPSIFAVCSSHCSRSLFPNNFRIRDSAQSTLLTESSANHHPLSLSLIVQRMMNTCRPVSCTAFSRRRISSLPQNHSARDACSSHHSHMYERTFNHFLVLHRPPATPPDRFASDSGLLSCGGRFKI